MRSRSCQEVLTLLSDLLAGEIAAEDIEIVEVHVTKCGSCRPFAEDLFWQHRALAEVAAHLEAAEFRSRLHALLAEEARRPPTAALQEPVVSSQPKEPSEVRSRRRWGRLVAAAAGLLAVLGTLWWTIASTEKPNLVLVVVERVDGEVHILESGKRRTCQAGAALTSGQSVLTGGQGSAVTLKYADGTLLELGEESQISELGEGSSGEPVGKRVSLAKGIMRAGVVRQPADRPMKVSTSHAEATVLGTTFRISVDVGEQASTRLEVKEGKVRLRRSLDGQAVDVVGGHFAVVAANAAFSPKPLTGWDPVTGYGWSVAYDSASESYRFRGVNSLTFFGGAALKWKDAWRPSKGHLELSYQYEVREPQRQCEIRATFQPVPGQGGESLHVRVSAGGLQVSRGSEQAIGSANFQSLTSDHPANVKIRIDRERLRVEINGKTEWAGLHGLDGPSSVLLRLTVGDVAGTLPAECILRDLTVFTISD